MKFHKTLQAIYLKLPAHQKPVALCITVFCSALLFIALFKTCYAFAFGQKKLVVTPLMIRQHDLIEIPANSALRQKLIIHDVKTSDKPHVVSFPGVVEADPTHIINVLPPVAGRLLSIQVKLGEKVHAKQTLATINSPELAQANADNNKAQAAHTLAMTSLKRAKEVFRVGGGSLKDIQLAQNDVEQTSANLKQTHARLKTIGQHKFSTLTIKAPTDGRITAINYGEGSYINDVTVPLLTISNLDTIWVTANVPESLAGVVEKNQPVDVFLPAYPDQLWHSKITFVNSFLEPSTRRNKTRIAFPNPHGKLQPNMFASVRVSIKQPNLIMIPISSILMNDDTVSVYVETSPWVFQRREIKLALEDDDHVRVLAGLHAGERIVQSGGVFIND